MPYYPPIYANHLIYRTIFFAPARATASAAGATNYIFNHTGGAEVQGAGAINSATTAGVFVFQAADYAITGLTTKMRLVVAVQTTNTAPAVNYVCTINPMTNTTTNWTVGAAVTGSTITFTTPAANSSTIQNSGDFTIPSDGQFAVIYTVSGTPAGIAGLVARVQIRNV